MSFDPNDYYISSPMGYEGGEFYYNPEEILDPPGYPFLVERRCTRYFDGTTGKRGWVITPLPQIVASWHADGQVFLRFYKTESLAMYLDKIHGRKPPEPRSPNYPRP